MRPWVRSGRGWSLGLRRGLDLLVSRGCTFLDEQFEIALHCRCGLRRDEFDIRLAAELSISTSFYAAQMTNLPLALAVDFMFTKRNVFQLFFATSLIGPSPNLVIGIPPGQLGKQDGCGGAGIKGPIIRIAFSLDTMDRWRMRLMRVVHLIFSSAIIPLVIVTSIRTVVASGINVAICSISYLRRHNDH